MPNGVIKKQIYRVNARNSNNWYIHPILFTGQLSLSDQHCILPR